MNIITSKRFIAIIAAAFGLSVMFESCGGDENSMTNKQVAELQQRLDSTMLLYENVKSQNADFDKQMASRDSAITAQAAEIQRLLDEAKSKKQTRQSVAPAATDSKQAERQQKEIRDKENTIRQLQKQIDEQTRQIKELQKNDVKKDNSAEYQKQIAKLQQQIASQEKQIADLNSETKKLKAEASSSKSDAADCNKMQQSYESQVAGLNGEIKDYKKQIAELNLQIKGLKSDVASLKSSSQASDTKTAEELAEARAELTKMTRQLNECRKQNTQYQNDVKDAQAGLATAQSELAKCQSDLDAQVAQVKSLQGSAGESGKTEQQLRAELASLTQKEAACKTRCDELDRSQKALIQQCETDKNTLRSNISSLQQQVSNMQQQIDKLTAENSQLKANKGGQTTENESFDEDSYKRTVADLMNRLEAQNAQIESLQADLRQKNAELAAAKSNTGSTGTKATKGNINQKLADLQAMCDGYVAEIERLRAENAQLKSENAELKEKVASSSSLISENERLQQKVKLASVLVTSDIRVTPGKSLKTGNVVKPTTKADQTKFIRIDCNLLDNNVVDPGSITIYARITNAFDRVVCNGNIENYSFEMGGVQMQYTTKQDIEFTGYGRNLTMLWRRADATDLQPGLYWVKLYANGYEIGKASFKLE